MESNRHNQGAGRLLAALVFLGAPMHAALISGTFDGTATLTPTGTPGVFTQSFTGDGLDAIFGAFTPTATSTIDFSNPPHIVATNGTFSQAFGSGSLFGTTSGSGTGNGAGSATFTIDVLFTGGTGEFAGDSGEATLTGTLTQTSPTTESITNGTYTGTVTAAPEPSTLLLLIPALGALGLRRRAYVR